MSNSVIGRRVHGPASPPAGVPPAPWVNGWAVSKRNPHQWVDPFRGLAGAPNQRKLLYRGRDGNRFPKQDDAGALRTSHLAIEMHWHRAAVLAHENSSRVRGDPQDLRILQPSESGVVRRTDVNSRRGPPQSAEYGAIKICVSLESDSHGAPAVASQSILHWSASTARVAIQQCTVLPQGRCRSLSGSPGSTQARRALVRGSRPGKNQAHQFVAAALWIALVTEIDVFGLHRVVVFVKPKQVRLFVVLVIWYEQVGSVSDEQSLGIKQTQRP